MVEGGVVKADKTEFTECWKTSWKTPYIMRLALSAGIGGLLFGYDTGKTKFNHSKILFFVFFMSTMVETYVDVVVLLLFLKGFMFLFIVVFYQIEFLFN